MRAIRSDAEHEWREVPRPEGDDTPPGEDILLFESADGKFTAGLWRRPVRQGAMTCPDHWVSIVIEGIAEVVDPDGTVHRAMSEDVLVTPRGSGGTWRCVTDVKKLWGICETDEVAPGTFVVESGQPLIFNETPGLALETALPGGEAVVWRSGDGSFACGLRMGSLWEDRMAPAHDEIAYLLEGDVEVESEREVLKVEPGDLLITPAGAEAVWRCLSTVRKFWVTYKGS